MTDEFSQPNRQSIFAIIMIIQKRISVIIRQIWPIIIVFLIGGNGSGRREYLLYATIVIALFSMVWSVISYFKYYFYIHQDELIIEKGVLSKTRLNIPFDRIQSVNFQQNVVHQLLKVIKVEIDTAGSAGNEFALDALSVGRAQRLRDIILARKAETDKHIVEAGAISANEATHVEEVEERILQLSVSDLIKVGISQNHLRSGLVIFFAGSWMMSQLNEVGFDFESQFESYFENAIAMGLVATLIIVVFFIVVSFIISLIRTVFTHFNLQVWRVGSKYRIIRGLFTRKETSAVDSKIQIIEWADNPLKRIFSYFDVRLKQASSTAVNAKQSIFIPGCQPTQIEQLKTNWLGEEALFGIENQGISIHYFYRRVLFRIIFNCILSTGLFIYENWLFWPSLLLLPYFIITSWLAYQKVTYAINHEILHTTRGVFGNWNSIMPLYKIQSVVLGQTPYQLRRDLATVSVMTASGKLNIPYVELRVAKQLKDYLLYRIETDRRDWI